MNSAHYFSVEQVEIPEDNSEPPVVNEWECENALGVASVLQSLEEDGELAFPTEIRIMKMVRLDAPLDDEEQADLESWTESLGSQEEKEEEDEEKMTAEEWQKQTTHEWDSMRGFPEEEETLTPVEGGRWFDPESEADWGSGYVTVIEMPGDTAGEWPLPDDEIVAGTVASYNDVPADEPVVVVTYEDGGPKQYAMPLSRLMPTCPACGPIEVEEVSGPKNHETCRLCGECISCAEL